MKNILLLLALILVCFLYFLPILFIASVAGFCRIFSKEDLTNSKAVVWFITPITWLSDKLDVKYKN